jgi:hypothetical protein
MVTDIGDAHDGVLMSSFSTVMFQSCTREVGCSGSKYAFWKDSVPG